MTKDHPGWVSGWIEHVRTLVQFTSVNNKYWKASRVHNWEFKFRGLGSFSAIRYPARAKSEINCGGGEGGGDCGYSNTDGNLSREWHKEIIHFLNFSTGSGDQIGDTHGLGGAWDLFLVYLSAFITSRHVTHQSVVRKRCTAWTTLDLCNFC